jgi:stalled ribosome alternative rescue factor ArfA
LPHINRALLLKVEQKKKGKGDAWFRKGMYAELGRRDF